MTFQRNTLLSGLIFYMKMEEAYLSEVLIKTNYGALHFNNIAEKPGCDRMYVVEVYL
jgi:hypothetical protein